jgi:uncharacterized protein YndB with AHSA1/START domain
MHLSSSIVVRQPPEQAWSFLADPFNSPRWDRSVAEVIPSSAGPVGVGWEATTIAPSGMRQSFRITEYVPNRTLSFVLLESSMFEQAELRFVLNRVAEGTDIVHVIEATPRTWLLRAVLRLVSRRALGRDLGYLKAALEHTYPVSSAS